MVPFVVVELDFTKPHKTVLWNRSITHFNNIVLFPGIVYRNQNWTPKFNKKNLKFVLPDKVGGSSVVPFQSPERKITSLKLALDGLLSQQHTLSARACGIYIICDHNTSSLPLYGLVCATLYQVKHLWAQHRQHIVLQGEHLIRRLEWTVEWVNDNNARDEKGRNRCCEWSEEQAEEIDVTVKWKHGKEVEKIRERSCNCLFLTGNEGKQWASMPCESGLCRS